MWEPKFEVHMAPLMMLIEGGDNAIAMSQLSELRLRRRLLITVPIVVWLLFPCMECQFGTRI